MTAMTDETAMSSARGARPLRGRSATRLGGLVLLLVVLLLGAAAPVSAHSTLERSDPQNGGMVATGATKLTLWFGSPVADSGNTFTVRSTDPSLPEVKTTATIDPGNTVVHLETAPLDRDTYTLTWAVVGDDGHPTRGTVIFGVGFRPDGVPSADSNGPQALPVTVRSLDLGGTLLALGALTISGGVLAALAGVGTRLRRRVLTLAAVGTTVSLLGALVTPVLTASNQLTGGGASLSDWTSAVTAVLLGGTWGLLWIVRLVALTAASAVLWADRVRARREADRDDAGAAPAPSRLPGALRVAAGLIVLSAVTDAGAGHASALPGRSAVAVVAAALHVLAAGVWAGGLVVLVLSVVPLMRADRTTRHAVVPALWRAYGPMAAVSAGVLVATGFYEAGRHVDRVSGVTRTVYGDAIVAKVVLVGLALAIAGYNSVLVNPRLSALLGRLLGRSGAWLPGTRRLTRTLTAEAVVLGVAVLVAAGMTTVPTDREVAVAEAVTTPHSDMVDGLFVTFEAVPTGSRLRLVVRTEAVVRPLPGPVTGVDVGIVGGDASTSAPLQAVRLEPGHYEAATEDPPTGDWTAQVVVHRVGRPDSVISVPWSSTSPGAVTPVELWTTAGSAFGLAGITAALVLVRRRRGPAGRGDGRPGGASGAEGPGPVQPVEQTRLEESGVRHAAGVGEGSTR